MEAIDKTINSNYYIKLHRCVDENVCDKVRINMWSELIMGLDDKSNRWDSRYGKDNE